MAEPRIAYLVFDVESASDGQLVSRLRYPGEGLTPARAVARYRRELLKEHGRDFVPYTYQVPVALVAAKVAADFRLLDVVALDEPEYRPHVIAERFWRGWEQFGRPTLVSFNGRTFDLPLLELAAFRYGLSLPGWFNTGAKAYDQHRNRFNARAHVDLMELLTNHGASRFTGGLDLAANLLGKPGKMEVTGDQVQKMFERGERTEIADYCRCDVLDTYFVFLRTRVLCGELDIDREQQLVQSCHRWIEQRADDVPAYAAYLKQWGDWENPWQAAEPEAAGAKKQRGGAAAASGSKKRRPAASQSGRSRPRKR